MQSLALTKSQVLSRSHAPVNRRTVKQAPHSIARSQRRVALNVQAAFAPPTVADTKAKFMNGYSKPISNLYSTVIQELLVQMHFIRHNIKYEYNEVYALGFVSVFEQILEGMDEQDRNAIFASYLAALEDTPEKFRADAALMEQQASSLSGPEALQPDENGTDLQKVLAKVAARSAAGNFAYNKFFAIGLFRLLELTGAKEPAALERLVKSVGVKPEAVNRDLMLYKGILSKMTAAKELMKEFLEREKRKQAERESDKAAKAAAEQAVQA